MSVYLCAVIYQHNDQDYPFKARIMVGDALSKLDKPDIERAKEFYRQAWSLSKGRPSHFVNVAKYFIRIAHETPMQFDDMDSEALLDQALKTAEEKLEIHNPTSDDTYLVQFVENVIQELAAVGRYNDAETLLLKLSSSSVYGVYGGRAEDQRSEENDKGYRMIAIAAARRSDLEQVSTFLDKMNLHKPEATLEIAKILAARGDYENALVAATVNRDSIEVGWGGLACDAGDRFRRNSIGVERGQALFEIGKSALEKGMNPKQVAEIFKTAIQVGFSNVWVLVAVVRKYPQLQPYLLPLLGSLLDTPSGSGASDVIYRYREILRALREFYPQLTGFDLPPDFSQSSSDPSSSIPRMGKTLDVTSMDLANNQATLSDGSTLEFDPVEEGKGNFDHQAPTTQIQGLVSEKNKPLIAAILSLFAQAPPVAYRRYTRLARDLFGFAMGYPPQSPLKLRGEDESAQAAGEPDLIARWSGFSDAVAPVADFHEAGEYLIRTGRLELKMKDNVDNVLVINGTEKLSLGPKALAIANKRLLPANKDKAAHYLLMALAQEIFGDLNEQLTTEIQAAQAFQNFQHWLQSDKRITLDDFANKGDIPQMLTAVNGLLDEYFAAREALSADDQELLMAEVVQFVADIRQAEIQRIHVELRGIRALRQINVNQVLLVARDRGFLRKVSASQNMIFDFKTEFLKQRERRRLRLKRAMSGLNPRELGIQEIQAGGEGVQLKSYEVVQWVRYYLAFKKILLGLEEKFMNLIVARIQDSPEPLIFPIDMAHLRDGAHRADTLRFVRGLQERQRTQGLKIALFFFNTEPGQDLKALAHEYGIKEGDIVNVSAGNLSEDLIREGQRRTQENGWSFNTPQSQLRVIGHQDHWNEYGVNLRDNHIPSVVSRDGNFEIEELFWAVLYYSDNETEIANALRESGLVPEGQVNEMAQALAEHGPIPPIGQELRAMRRNFRYAAQIANIRGTSM